jgi:hypothetical protein
MKSLIHAQSGEEDAKMMISRYRLAAGDRLPSFYGLAYHDFERAVTFAYPIPINIFIRWFRNVVCFLQTCRPSWEMNKISKLRKVAREEIYAELVQINELHFNRGYEQCRIDLLARLDDESRR